VVLEEISDNANLTNGWPRDILSPTANGVDLNVIDCWLKVDWGQKVETKPLKVHVATLPYIGKILIVFPSYIQCLQSYHITTIGHRAADFIQDIQVSLSTVLQSVPYLPE